MFDSCHNSLVVVQKLQIDKSTNSILVVIVAKIVLIIIILVVLIVVFRVI